MRRMSFHSNRRTTRIVRRGATGLAATAPGNWVWECKQRSLIQCYGQGIDADGKYEGDTQEAVRNVQRFHNHFGAGLAVDGIYGPKTAYYMEFVNTQGKCWT